MGASGERVGNFVFQDLVLDNEFLPHAEIHLAAPELLGYFLQVSSTLGPKLGATTGGLLLAAGCVLAGLMKSYLGLILGFGVLGGSVVYFYGWTHLGRVPGGSGVRTGYSGLALGVALFAALSMLACALATFASTLRRTRPHRSSSQDASSPIWY